MRRALIAVLIAACAGEDLPSARFAVAPPVTAVADRADVPAKPAVRREGPLLANLDGQIYRPLRRLVHPDGGARALGVNALDEVPDSTWFTNRIGVRAISPAELAAAPGGVGSPEAHTPWTIHGTKIGGESVGFLISDARGEKFLVKFDTRGHPEAETGAHVVSGKLLWACGYNVTEDYIAYVGRRDLVLAPDAESEDVFGTKRPLDAATVERELARVELGRDGRYRTMVSRLIPGKPIGSHPVTGTRDDDPNDLVPHERRRDLRGARAIFAWLDHDDVHEGQFLDVWTSDAGRHYVMHYLVDYGMSLGVMARLTRNLRRSYEYAVDPLAALRGFVTLGLARRPWAERRAPELRGVGVYETAAFRPGAWKPTTQIYVPFVTADRFDNFWGAKLVMRFTRAQLRAAVEAGRFTDPRAVDYLTEALVTRQRATGAYWFTRVNPLDRFVALPGAVCFDDLLLVYRLAPRGTTTRYRLDAFDRAGHELGTPRVVAANRGGTTCAPIRLAADGDGYTIVRVETTRPGFVGTTYVHLARGRDGAPRVVGIWRT